MEKLKDDILQNLESIVEKTSKLENHHKKEIPQIELDVILVEVQQLYAKYQKLAKINSQKQNLNSENNKLDEIIARSQKTLEMVESMSNLEVELNVETDKNVEEGFEPINVLEEPVVNIETDNEIEKKLLEPNAIVATQYQIEKKSLNEKLSDTKTDNSLAFKLQKKPIDDLKKEIGLNEKFLFTKELFNDSTEDYERAISKLNQIGDLKSANEILNALKLRYKWSNYPETYEILADLVSRRYM